MLVVGTVARRGFRQGMLTAVGANAASLVMIAGAMLMVFGVVLVSERLLTGLHVAGLRVHRGTGRPDAARRMARRPDARRQ
ncbi:hypothetical protein [Burkholderia contaminans]|uniref:hypothetical protein n=1 Tax=Burkholderia contaminans TaxID=488447 RepID=UPI001CEC31CE|nr:hypothetical protein [Burkholderia contaminans]